MALRRGLVTVGAAVACCALTAACTSEPAPGATSSPTPRLATPTESQIERQMRLDYEAAEDGLSGTYMRSRIGLYRAGGVNESTPALKATATGSYLRITLQSLRDVHKPGGSARGTTKIARRRSDGGWK